MKWKAEPLNFCVKDISVTAPLNLADVCKFWRKLVQETLTLVIKCRLVVHFDPHGKVMTEGSRSTFRLMQRCLIRSATAQGPMDVELFMEPGGWDENPADDAFLKELQVTFHKSQTRWRRVNIKFFSNVVWPLGIDFNRLSLAPLTDLNLHCCTIDHQLCKISPTLTLASLKNLKLWHCSTSYLELLIVSPNLESFTWFDLHDDETDTDEESDGKGNKKGVKPYDLPISKLRLPRLKELEYTAQGIPINLLKVLKCPALRCLRINLVENGHKDPFLLDFIKRNKDLALLAITVDAEHREQLVEILHALPKLTTLCLENADEKVMDKFTEVVRNEKTGKVEHVLCKDVEDFLVWDYRGDTKHMLSFIKSRWNANPRSLRRLALINPPEQFEFWSEADEYVEKGLTLKIEQRGNEDEPY